MKNTNAFSYTWLWTRKEAVVCYGSPDGINDPVWDLAEKIELDVIKADKGIFITDYTPQAEGFVRLLWDQNFLYVLYTVNDSTRHPDPSPAPLGANPGTLYDSAGFQIDPYLSGGAHNFSNGLLGTISRATGNIGAPADTASPGIINRALTAGHIRTAFEDGPEQYKILVSFALHKIFPEFELAGGARFGMDFNFNDNSDGTAGANHVMTWNDYDNMVYDVKVGLDHLGILTLAALRAGGDSGAIPSEIPPPPPPPVLNVSEGSGPTLTALVTFENRAGFEGELGKVFYFNGDGGGWSSDSGGLPTGVTALPHTASKPEKDTYYSITFEGSVIEIYGLPSRNQGIAAISADGGPETTVDCYVNRNTVAPPIELIYTSPVLPEGTHTIKVRRAYQGTGDSRNSISFAYANVFSLPPPDPSTAGEWARDGIISAAAKGFIPANARAGFTSPVTREEFCTMAVMFVEYAMAKPIETVMAEKGIAHDPDVFTDTDSRYITAAAALGITEIITGTAAGIFSPGSEVTHGQALECLMKVCGIIGMDMDKLGNPDKSKDPAFAFSGRDAQDAYTREQSIVSFDRITTDHIDHNKAKP